MIKAELGGTLPGIETLIFNAANNGVSIPSKNPNLDSSVESKVGKVFDLIKSGGIVVAAEQGSLIK